MMSTGGPFAMANPGQQVFMSNQTLPGGMMGPDPQRSPSSSHLVMSTTQNRSPGSPRRSSSQVKIIALVTKLSVFLFALCSLFSEGVGPRFEALFG